MTTDPEADVRCNTYAPDLHALANLPGAGKAFDVLAEAGFTGDDPTAPRWRVTLYATQRMATSITVRAHSPDEAKKIAASRANAARGRPDLVHWEAIEDVEPNGDAYAESGEVEP
jgi:hypothetical protein